MKSLSYKPYMEITKIKLVTRLVLSDVVCFKLAES